MDDVVSGTLCGYCDASLSAYAAVIYLLIESESGSYMHFVASKTRVSPLKRQTIPRLELLSALLLARLMETVTAALKSVIIQCRFHRFQCFTVLDSRRAEIVETLRAESCIRDSPFVFCGVLETLSGSREPCRCSFKRDFTSEMPCVEMALVYPLPVPGCWMMRENSLKKCHPSTQQSNRPSTVGLLTREVGDVSKIVKVEDFSNMSHLIGVVTRVLSWCSILRKKINPDRHTTFNGSVAETLLIKSAQSYLKENKQW